MIIILDLDVCIYIERERGMVYSVPYLEEFDHDRTSWRHWDGESVGESSSVGER